jgi:nitrogen fixation/metabolism regulation signal transduction histidine kinase
VTPFSAEVTVFVALCGALLVLLVLAHRRGHRLEAERDALARALGETQRRDGSRAQRRNEAVQTLLDVAPMAAVVFDEPGRIIYTNRAARELFFEGKSLEGESFLALLKNAPEPLRRAIVGDRDELFTVDEDGEAETYRLVKRVIHLDDWRAGGDHDPNASGPGPHTLLLVEHLTQELRRQEVETLKKMIRVISHELNNSLAPISSLVHSARVLAKGSEIEGKLERVFVTVAERADHLTTFLQGYAKFARMPAPRKTEVAWAPFLDELRAIAPEAKIGAPPDKPGWFDATQMEQVLVNLLKNAQEAGSAANEIEVAIEPASESSGDGVSIFVRDRGKGMSPDVMRQALLPFFSTKETGTGLGLALCREIVEAHGGRLRIRNREGGGAEVTLRVPGEAPSSGSRARLTLTRA